ncbi:DoxX family protein [Gillisia limnaea]|uniref:DoxX family protein n=1 Tax=Gillisia limnaea (strain DSM 15749 / LMG 21470 / R-8282) TaxID=865937 RepID=H2BVM8_GILLR|nr:DoxX family membrane protein [Gillisia limnaea]EHQ03984.1 DoxX family protein [Gillisia limnaea DSM 15749]
MTAKIMVTQRSVHIFRMMLSGIFLVAGFNHLMNLKETVAKLDQASFKSMAYFIGNPEYLIIISGIIMLAAGIGLLAGFKTQWAAAILALILIPITITVQVGQVNSLGPLFKNIAIMGGLLFFILNDFKTTKQ